jgi:hypothetical protein
MTGGFDGSFLDWWKQRPKRGRPRKASDSDDGSVSGSVSGASAAKSKARRRRHPSKKIRRGPAHATYSDEDDSDGQGEDENAYDDEDYEPYGGHPGSRDLKPDLGPESLRVEGGEGGYTSSGRAVRRPVSVYEEALAEARVKQARAARREPGKEILKPLRAPLAVAISMLTQRESLASPRGIMTEDVASNILLDISASSTPCTKLSRSPAISFDGSQTDATPVVSRASSQDVDAIEEQQRQQRAQLAAGFGTAMQGVPTTDAAPLMGFNPFRDLIHAGKAARVTFNHGQMYKLESNDPWSG